MLMHMDCLLLADIIVPLTFVSLISLSFSIEISESAILMPIKLGLKQLLQPIPLTV